jgi:hypothetical protein
VNDTAIRPITIAEQAEAAARRFVQTGEKEENPHRATGNEQRWRSCFDRWVLALSAGVDEERGA